MLCFNRQDLACEKPVRKIVMIMIVLLVLANCSRGPLGADARLGKPTSLEETRQALRSSKPAPSPNCLRNTTRQSIQFEIQTGTDPLPSGWQRWILPPGQVMHLGDHQRAEIRFVSVPVGPDREMPGNSAALVHYQLDLVPPLQEVRPAKACLHEFRPRSNGMLDLFLNSDLVA